ncbi:MYO1 [Enterospora canceri]|uniref:MYO1 n=1 Tax=Enterospora canceri TaxID=1081671 RepID=A0A1Y1S8J7_9MICR|nr:MYO1 [Enterospora canceri]
MHMDNEDLCKQKNLDNESLLNTLSERYELAEIYTNCGLLLLSINPYARLDIYSENIKQMYKKGHNLKPHIFMLIEECLKNIRLRGEHSIIISGESGAGKTECTKIILKYLDIEQIEAVDMIVESIGNAKTVYNNNSSRFGKLIRVGKTIKLETFLLEKSRVTEQAENEQNFHIFYYLLAGNNLLMDNDYITVHRFGKYKEKYMELKQAFKMIGIDFEYIERMLLGVLHIGSINFEDWDDGQFDQISSTFNISRSVLEEYLTYKTMKIRDEEIKKKYTIQESKMLRNSLARLIYSKIFDYIIMKINEHYSGKTNATQFEEGECLNILDIFGFENFDKNGLNQFCINWCNEKLYDEFVKRTFEHQKAIFAEEELDLLTMRNSNGSLINLKGLKMGKSALNLIEKKCGLVDLIAEESIINGTPDNLCNKIRQYLKLAIKFDDTFVFKHYVGDLDYNCSDFVEKNKEKADVGLIAGNKFVIQNNTEDVCKNVVGYFRKSMRSLFDVLNKTELKYIKCIKPNNKKAEMHFDRGLVAKQLRANGILQTIQLSKHMFAYQCYIDEFEERYSFLFAMKTRESECAFEYDGNSLLKSLVKGKTRYFFNNETLKELEKVRVALSMIRLNLHKRRMERVFYVIQRVHRLEKERIENVRIEQEKALVVKLETERRQQEAKMKEELSKKAEEKLPDEIIEIEQMCVIKQENENPLPQKERVVSKNNTKSNCNNCRVLEQKYKFQSQKLLRLQGIELEYEKLRKEVRRLTNAEDSSESFDGLSSNNIYRCMIQIYIDHAPMFSEKDVPKDEMLSMAHGLFYAINRLDDDFNLNLAVTLEEVSRRLDQILANTQITLFFLSNTIELLVLCADSVITEMTPTNRQNLIDLIHLFHKEVTHAFKTRIRTALPFSIIEHQAIKELKVKESIFKKIFTGTTISQLVSILDEVVDWLGFYYVPETHIHGIFAHLLGYVDFESFNSLLIKRNYLSFNRCAQINYNLSEITKFCYRIGYTDVSLSLGHITEAVKLATAMAVVHKSSNKKDCAYLTGLINNTFLNPLQINTLIDLFEEQPLQKIGCRGIVEKFIREPADDQITVELYSDITAFVIPKFIPNRAMRSIIRVIEQNDEI